MQTKDLRLELKAVNDDGTFEGYLSVYDVVDLGNDVVEKGAFTKTISENKGQVPLLWNHDSTQDMGLLSLIDDAHGLKVSGDMFIVESPLAREKHAMAKRYHEAGRPVGLSIGYEAIKKVMDKGLRRLKEVKLYEGSMTLFPMLPVAHLTSIKSGERKDDFLTELDEAQTRAMRYMMIDALSCSLCETLYDQALSPDDKATASDESIQQFRATYADLLPKLLTLMEDNSWAYMSAKAGRVISSANRTMLQEAISKLQALLDASEVTSTEAPTEKAAATPKSEPEPLHSWLSAMRVDFETQLAAL